ncbi:maleylpyruvate isomerase family mycothiol-dependent enzyme [Nocardioides sp. YIM 152588]|uniref:maleylpyruvate isomerase family mycothiol-dependent enzyme n=1 Tax=Nocardioides sp. YIM 152588 TaxID=3158259 RepID=UPI0032E50C3C
MPGTPEAARAWFAAAAGGFLALLPGIDGDRLAAVGLGEWDVRSLLGHTCRAFSTIEAYLGATGDGDAPPDALLGTLDYFVLAAQGRADPAQVAQRGRDAGAALGDEPVAAARGIAERGLAAVERTPDAAVLTTPLGPMALVDYLPTRAFELTVHGLDLARATGQEPPPPLARAVPDCLALVAAVLSTDDRGVAALLALTGREPLPAGFRVI